jgi:hypothetical protein
MKQCQVPQCGFTGEVGYWRTVYVPESPYKPSDMVVECPSCKRRGKIGELVDSISEFEQRKREAMKAWVPLTKLAPEVSDMLSHKRCRIPIKGGQHYG